MKWGKRADFWVFRVGFPLFCAGAWFYVFKLSGYFIPTPIPEANPLDFISANLFYMFGTMVKWAMLVGLPIIFLGSILGGFEEHEPPNDYQI